MMGFRWTQKHGSPIGVDFGADSIKLLQVMPEDPPRLIAAAAIDLPDDARRDAEAYRQFVVPAFREALSVGGFRGKRIVASISAANTYVQHVRMAKMDAQSLDGQIELELRGRLPIDPAAMVIRHVSAGEVVVDGQSKMELICFAASRESIMRTVQISRSAGLDVVGMHCEPMAILEAFGHLFRRTTDVNATTFFVDIGGATTKALIAHGRSLVFAKTIHVGGEHFARELSQRESIALPEARLRRVQMATTVTDFAEPIAATTATLAVAGDRRKTVDADFATVATQAPPAPVDCEMLDSLIDELQLCIGYHGSMFASRPIDKIVFLGGESRHKRMCQRIAQSLRMPAQLGDPLARLVRSPDAATPVHVDLRCAQPGWAVPMGLCLLPTNL